MKLRLFSASLTAAVLASTVLSVATCSAEAGKSGLSSPKWSRISAGGSHRLAIKEDGTVWSYITSITGNFTESFAVDESGSLWGWGFVSVPYQTKPAKFKSWTNIKSFAVASSGQLVAVKKDGSVWMSGKKGPEAIPRLDHVTSVATCSGSSFALKEDGSVWAWGQNHNGALGDGTTTDQPAPIRNPYIQDVKEIQATRGGPVYLKKDGTVWANGSNLGGHLGIGTYEDSLVPVQVKGLTHITAISASNTSSGVMALREDGTLWSWGDGNVGDGTAWWRTTPVMIRSDPSQLLETFDTVKVDIDGKAVQFDQFPLLVNETTMVPMRKIFETLGASVQWDAETFTVTATSPASTVQLAVGAPIAIINGESKLLDSPPVIINESLLVPVRFIAESFGARVGWDEVTSTVQIDTSGTILQ